VDPDAARARRQREGATDDAPRAHHVRRVASVVRTQPAVMELIKADAERRDPAHRQPVVVRLDGALGLWNLAPKRFTPWKRLTCILDILHVVGYLWSAANALFGEGAKDGTRGVQAKRTAMLRGRVGLRQRRTAPDPHEAAAAAVGAGDARKSDHVLPQPPALDAVRCIPGGRLARGTGVVESACGSVVKHRMEGDGTRWSLAGAEAILALRSLKKSHDHDLRDYWRFRAHQVRVRLDGGKPKYGPMPRLRRVA